MGLFNAVVGAASASPDASPPEPAATEKGCENCRLEGKGNIYHWDDPKAKDSCEACCRSHPDRWTPRKDGK